MSKQICKFGEVGPGYFRFLNGTWAGRVVIKNLISKVNDRHVFTFGNNFIWGDVENHKNDLCEKVEPIFPEPENHVDYSEARYRSDEINWLPFFGNNRNKLTQCCRRGGCFNFANHYGKPLSNQLWEDLTERLGCTYLKVYRWDQHEYIDNEMTPVAKIYLDEDKNVRDIAIHM
jgi:hypothetical protein